MNLHGIAGPIVSAVNPTLLATVKISTGYTKDAAYKQVPTYDTVENVPAQVQSLTFKDLQQTQGLNLNGLRRAIYLYGRFDGVVRAKIKGGDLVTLVDGPAAGVWLVNQNLEQWPDWCKVAVTLQQDS